MVTLARAQHRSSLFLMVTRDVLAILRTAALLGWYRLPFPLPGPGVSTKVVSTVKMSSGVKSSLELSLAVRATRRWGHWSAVNYILILIYGTGWTPH